MMELSKERNEYLHSREKHVREQKNLRRYNHDHHKLSLLVLLTKQKKSIKDWDDRISLLRNSFPVEELYDNDTIDQHYYSISHTKVSTKINRYEIFSSSFLHLTFSPKNI